MDRPIGNTPEVHAECEKWYVESEELSTRQLTRAGMHGMPSAIYHAPKQNAATSPP